MKSSSLFGAIAILLVAMMIWGTSPIFAQSQDSRIEAADVSGAHPPLRLDSGGPTVDMFCGRTFTTREMAYSVLALRKRNAPRPGALAPDFRLLTADGDRAVSLSELASSKPVVLILSSWGCDIFRESLSGLQELHSRYAEEAHFVMVYCREVHPLDGFAGNLGRVNDAKTIEERMLHARRCREQLRLPFLMLVDTMMDSVATRWAALPVRTFVVDTDGKVGFASAQGPWGYRPYRGFQHGSGEITEHDREFSPGTLEEFLETRFPENEVASNAPESSR
ncbi:MAG: redoxin domain-containing protein [Verrucomicrobiales bacterium]|nr:redoxin domain-containing protein [Verrucomicrobiales bacterium]